MAAANVTEFPEPEQTCALCPVDSPTPAGARLRHCVKCGRLYCKEHFSPISPFHCCDCRPLVVRESELVRTDVVEDYDEVNDKVTRAEKISRCKLITFEGPDRSFYAEAIYDRSIEELRGFVVMHKAIVKLMEDEILTKVIKGRTAIFQMAAGSAPSPSPAPAPVPKPPKQPKAKKTFTPDQIAAAIKNVGLSPEQMAALVKQFGDKK